MISDSIHPSDTPEEREAAEMADDVFRVLITCKDSRIFGGPGCVPCDSFLAAQMVYFLEITA